MAGYHKESVAAGSIINQLTKPTFHSRYVLTPFTEQSEGP